MRSFYSVLLMVLASCGFAAEPILNNQQPVACNVDVVAKNLAQACDKKYGEVGVIDWQPQQLVENICRGVVPGIGQKTIFSIIGNAKICPGNAPVPEKEGWICDFSMDFNYQVEVKNIYYMTCMG